MKKTCLFVLSFILLFVSCACAESTPIFSNMNPEELLAPELPEDWASDDATYPEEDGLISSSIAASGSLVWRVSGTEIVCADATARQDTTGISINELFESENSLLRGDRMYSLNYLRLISRDESSIWLCAALTDEEELPRVLLFTLALSGGRITVSSITDVTVSLSPFFSGDTDWLEIDMTGCGDGNVLVAALDQEQIFHLYNYRPANKQLTGLGTQPLIFYLSAIPYGSSVLLTEFSLEEENALDLVLLPLSGGKRTLLKTFAIGSDPFSTANFAWSPEENLLYFTIRNSACRIAPGSGEPPVPFAVTDRMPALNRLGVIAGGQYVLYAEDGSLIYNDLHAELASAMIRIADTTENETLPDLAAGFNGEQSEYYIAISDLNEESLFPEDQDNSNNYDICIIRSDSPLYGILTAPGSFTDLSGSETSRSAAANMPAAVQSAVYDGGRLYGLPIYTESDCLTLNVSALQDLSGISREEIPTDWPGFLRLLNRLSADGILTANPQYTLLDSCYTTGDLKEALFARIINDCLLQVQYADPAGDCLTGILLPSLQEFSSIDWDGFGLPETEAVDEDQQPVSEQIPLLSAIQPEIAVTAMEPGMEYWPLSAGSEYERLIPQAVSILIVNPGSPQGEGALAFAEYAWNNLDILTKMSLSKNMNEPVENTDYDEDIAYLEQLAASCRFNLMNAETDEEAASLQQELTEVEDFLDDYRANAVWLASEQSIAEYRALSGHMTPAVPAFPGADEEDGPAIQFLDGRITAGQFVSALQQSLSESD